MNITVQSGDTLWKIAQDHGITVAQLKQANGLTSDFLQVGQVLRLPGSGQNIYTIVAGDTLQVIANKFHTTPGEIKRANNMNSDALFIGHTLVIPSQAPAPQPAPSPVAKAWYYPVLPWGSYNNNSGKFLDPVYYSQIGAEHPGVDLNGNGGGNTDYGDPVYAVSDGIVLDVTYEPVWGNLMLIDHDDVLCLYAHCSKVLISTGQRVSGRQQIGAIGRGADNIYLAHLHFETRKKFPGRPRLPTGNWPSALYPNRYDAQSYIRANYYSPLDFLRGKNARVT